MKNKIKYIFNSLIFITFISNAQIIYLPSVNLSTNRGCVPLTVTFTGFSTTAVGITTTLSSCVNFVYTFGDGSASFSSNSVHTYSVAGIYTMTGFAACDGRGKPFDKKYVIEVLPLPIPDYEVFGCQSLTGNVRINKNDYDFYTIQWGDGIVSNSVLGNNTYSHKYSNTSIKNITLSGTYLYTIAGLIQSCESNKIIKSIQVYPPLKEATIESLEITKKDASAGTANLQLITSNELKYAVFIKNGINGNYNLVRIITTTNGSNTFEITNTNTSNLQTYKIVAFDDCGTTTTGVEISSIVVNATADVSKNTIDWNNNISSTDNIVYNLSVNGVQINSQSLKTTVINDLKILKAFDINVECNKEYCYKVTGISQNSSSTKSISAPTCVQGLKPATITGIKKFHSSFENSKVQLSWQPNSSVGINYLVYGINGNERILLNQTTNNFINGASTNYRCYAIVGSQTCGISPERITCPIILTGKKDNIVQNSLQWTPYINGDTSTITQAQIEWFTDKLVPIAADNLSNNQTIYLHNPIDELNQKVRYRIKNILADGTIVYSDYQDIIQELRLYSPTSFTPNSDGKNDTFFPKGLFWKEYKLDIYNRWGERLFSSDTPYQGWDGENATPGLYSFTVRVEDFFGNVLKNNGTLTLTRE